MSPKGLQKLVAAWVMMAALALAGPARAIDRQGEWDGDIGIGAIVLKDDSGFAVNGRLRYYFTDNFAFGPAAMVGFTDPVNVYNIRGLFRAGTIVAEGKSPVEIYLEAGAGAIIFDHDIGPTKTDLVIPFGGGFHWQISRKVAIGAGILLNVTTNNREELIPEFFGGIAIRR